MSAPDAIEWCGEVVLALNPFFSAPIAQALVKSTLRRAKLDCATLDAHTVRDAVVALERALPIYIADEGRRSDCVARLRRLVQTAAAGHVDVDRKSEASKAPEERVRTTASTTVRVVTADDVRNACDVGRDLARRVGFGNVDQTKIATAISELARNIVLYALRGEVRITSIDAGEKGVEVTAIDEGPGIADVSLVMSGAYQSRTGMGMGLKGAKRLMDYFDIVSERGVGTTIVARKFVA